MKNSPDVLYAYECARRLFNNAKAEVIACGGEPSEEAKEKLSQLLTDWAQANNKLIEQLETHTVDPDALEEACKTYHYIQERQREDGDEDFDEEGLHEWAMNQAGEAYFQKLFDMEVAATNKET